MIYNLDQLFLKYGYNLSSKINIDCLMVGYDLASDVRNYLASYKSYYVLVDLNTKKFAQLYGLNNIIDVGICVPSIDLVNSLKGDIGVCDVLVSVGSGSITDVCKKISYDLGIEHIIVATSPSMNGYCSSVASLLNEKKCKKSYNVSLACAVFFDLSIILSSPIRMIKAGVGDSMCVSSIVPDLMIGDMIFDVSYDVGLLRCVESVSSCLVNNVDKIFSLSEEGMIILLENLIVSGLSMHITGSSMFASQSEHMVVHYYNWKYGDIGNLHGEEVIVLCVYMRKLIEKMISFDDINMISESELSFLYKKLDKDLDESEKKYKNLYSIEKNIKNSWHNEKNRIISSTLNSENLENFLQNVGMPSCFKDINWHRSEFIDSISKAVFFRNRYNILDFCVLSGYIDVFCEAIE